MQNKKFSTVKNYTIVQTLGKGVTAKVKLCYKDDDRNTLYAIKIYKNDKNDEQNKQALIKEIAAMKSLNHKNIIKVYDVLDNVDYQKKNGKAIQIFAIILEYAYSGELYEYIAQEVFPENMLRTYFHQLMDGLNYIHQQGMCHRDLKPNNLLFDKYYNLKIADFGFSTFMGKNFSGYLHTCLGTDGYMAPELYQLNDQLQAKYVGTSIDIFACGIILFTLYAQYPPIESGNPEKCVFYKLLASHKYDEFWELHSKNKPEGYYSEEFKDLINNLLQVEPSLRLSLSEIIAHPWFNGPQVTGQQIKEEFSRRKELIESKRRKSQLEKRLEKEKRLKQQEETNQSIYVGVKAYRSPFTYKNPQLVGLQEIYKNIQSPSREIKQLYSEPQPKDIITYADKDYLLIKILDKQSEICSDKFQLDDNKYRLIGTDRNREGNCLDFIIDFLSIAEDGVVINIRKIQVRWRRSIFKIKKTTQFKKLMDAYCQRQSVSPHNVRFLFDGDRILETNTPNDLSMENGDEIDVVIEQVGGY